MSLKNINILFSIFFVTVLFGQKKEDVLFTIDGDNVYTSEFIRVYQKNKDIVLDEEKKEFVDYLDIFIDFKLKLKEAKDLQLDTMPNYLSELSKYKEQLIEPYLQNSEAIEKLAKEAYERTLTEVNASHILIRLAPNAKPKDTLAAYKKIMNARRKIMTGIPFEKVAKEYSEDPSVKTNSGNLGYFTAFSMVYPFENAAYHTKVGEISNPFRTQFGYHLVKVNDKRPSKGEREVAHIMIKNNLEDSLYAKNKIFDIYNKLKQGGDFAKIAQEHSDDLGSAKKGGVLPKFGSGKMIKPFDTAAFSLKNEGDFSEPFHTKYGWHILKLLKKYPIGSFETLQPYLESKIKNGNRSKLLDNDLAEKLAKDYQIKEDVLVLSAFYLEDEKEMNSNATLLSINESKYSAKDFYNYFKKEKNKTTNEIYNDFKNEKIINYYKDHLEETNTDFVVIYQEYKDGLMLFDLLQNNIWEKSEKDTIGLTNYFNTHRDKYVWKKRANLDIASCTTLGKANLVKKYLEENKTTDQIKELVNEGATIHVLFSSGTLEEGSSKLPKDFRFNLGVSKIFNPAKNQYTIVNVTKIMEPVNKNLNETRGQVINDYQKELEDQWIVDLRNKYKVKMNKKNLKKLKRQFETL